MRLRMLIALVIAILLLLFIIILVAAALLLSTGNPPEGEISGTYGLVYSIEAVLAEMIDLGREWIDYIAGQIARLSGNL
ncbi:MAG: hypothetical protein LUQ12_01625 [Methanoregulaceae archaeon]|nr:hypothetical protein [Methanoregulaceae archaeon]